MSWAHLFQRGAVKWQYTIVLKQHNALSGCIKGQTRVRLYLLLCALRGKENVIKGVESAFLIIKKKGVCHLSYKYGAGTKKKKKKRGKEVAEEEKGKGKENKGGRRKKGHEKLMQKQEEPKDLNMREW